ncbi:MAG TPA: DUF58 domain-containing protein [Acidiferrobacterales bacterium]|nr:DUF58 domain-containing protein [Acidiferrobacterales bacterium]
MVLGTRQIYILPTRHGLLFALVLVALALAAVNYSNALAYLLSFLLASMAVVSLLHAQRNLLKLRVTAAGGDPVFAGEPALFRICLDNDSGARYALRIESARGVLPPFDIPAHDTRCVALSVPTVKRGWLDCPPLTLASVYPLGITRAWSRRLTLPARCLVYPKPAEETHWQTTAGIEEGESRPGGMQDGEDFAGLRAYQPGDAPARISWKTLARGQGLYTKEFRAPLAESVWLDWDAFTPHDVEMRLSLLCRATLDAEGSGLAYGLRLPGVVLEPDSGATHHHRCLEALALYETVA